ncbi:MAG: hypothetical protein ACI835_004279 [Planctomycetota bacterium]|jgi:hypothetical protein
MTVRSAKSSLMRGPIPGAMLFKGLGSNLKRAGPWEAEPRALHQRKNGGPPSRSARLQDRQSAPL